MNKPTIDPKDYELLKSLVLSKQCIAFIGSGPSIGIFDSWRSMVNNLAEYCGCDSKVKAGMPADQLLVVAEKARCADITRYHEYIGNHFGTISKTDFLYGVLLKLPFKCYLTVNLDPLLAMEAREHGLGIPKTYPALNPAHLSTKQVFHLHGLVTEGLTPKPGTIVLSESEFKGAYAPGSKLQRFVLSAIEDYPICFIGCGLREPVMKPLFDMCRKHQDERIELERQYGRPASPPKRLILLPNYGVELKDEDPKKSEELRTRQYDETKYYRSLQIEPIRYNPDGLQHPGLRRVFERIAEYKELGPYFGFDDGDNHGS